MDARLIRATGSVASACLLAALSLPSAAQDHHAHSTRLGTVHFKVDCNDEAQKAFDLAMSYYHSFAWNHVKEPIDRVLAADPGCGMAHWARTMALLDNPFAWPVNISAKVLSEGPAALEQARKTGLKSERERDYVAALETFFKDHDKLPHRIRAKALEEAMDQLARRYPEDSEAAILHALVLSANFDPADKSYSNQLRAAQILEPIFAAQPEHPGVAHYLIHSFDYPPIANRGLDAARRYSKIAPDAAHALHMPSHIFTRVGDWRNSVESNIASAASASPDTFDKLHAYDYMVYAHLQLGQDQAASKVIEQARNSKAVDHFAFAYACAALPARLALERGSWGEAAKLELFPSVDKYSWKKYPQAEAINAFARGMGAALSQDPGSARAEIARLNALREAMAAMKNAYWVEQIDIQAEVVRAMASVADGRRDEGIAILRQAADREDATQKHVVTPGPIVPAREVLAQTLLGADRVADALREFESVLQREPNRYRAIAGAAQAAERSGDARKAGEYYTRLHDLTVDADTSLVEIAQAKRFIGR